MTAHSSRLPMGLAPLIAEAKQRMRRRRSLVALAIVLAGLAVALSLALRSPSGGPGVPHPPTSSPRARELTISIPRGLSSYDLRGGGHMVGTQAPVIGHVLANFGVPAHLDIQRVLGQWAEPDGSGPPKNAVALKFGLDVASGPPPLNYNLHLPLTVDQPWFEEKLRSGGIGYRWGYLRFHNQYYDVMYWNGPAAPAKDRAAILRALKSIRPAR